jgi:hypothetical protein
MATPKAIAQCVLYRKGLIPEDNVVNVLHFEGDDAPTTDDRQHWDDLVPGLVSRLQTFYSSIGGILASTLAGTGQVKVYDFSDPKPRVPRVVAPLTFTAGSGALPAEVAVCLSMVGAPVSGKPQARRRGRIYIGPLIAAMGGSTSTQPDLLPTTGNQDIILNAAKIMATGSAGSFRLAVHSPTSEAQNPGGDDSWTDVATLYTDNAFDTQRRRGARATLRRTLTV